MIAGTGIDVIEVSRIAEIINREDGFKERVFSAREILYCEVQVDRYQHYAARFAAKEAFLKATGLGLSLGDLSEIEILNEESGQPKVILHSSIHEQANLRGWGKVHVSLSHIKDIACATVIIEKIVP